MVRGLVFDTTAANTGLNAGACTLIEALDRKLIWLACRHHVYEVLLSDVFSAALGATDGPEIGLFKRFQKNWSYIDKNKVEAADDKVFCGMPDGLRHDMISFYSQAVTNPQNSKAHWIGRII